MQILFTSRKSHNCSVLFLYSNAFNDYTHVEVQQTRETAKNTFMKMGYCKFISSIESQPHPLCTFLYLHFPHKHLHFCLFRRKSSLLSRFTGKVSPSCQLPGLILRNKIRLGWQLWAEAFSTASLKKCLD